MNIDPEMLACLRAEYNCLHEDLRHIEKGEWKPVSRREMLLVQERMRRLAVLVVLNDWAAAKPH